MRPGRRGGLVGRLGLRFVGSAFGRRRGRNRLRVDVVVGCFLGGLFLVARRVVGLVARHDLGSGSGPVGSGSASASARQPPRLGPAASGSAASGSLAASAPRLPRLGVRGASVGSSATAGSLVGRSRLLLVLGPLRIAHPMTVLLNAFILTSVRRIQRSCSTTSRAARSRACWSASSSRFRASSSVAVPTRSSTRVSAHSARSEPTWTLGQPCPAFVAIPRRLARLAASVVHGQRPRRHVTLRSARAETAIASDKQREANENGCGQGSGEHVAPIMSGVTDGRQQRADQPAHSGQRAERRDHDADRRSTRQRCPTRPIASVIAPNTRLLRNATTRPISSIGVSLDEDRLGGDDVDEVGDADDRRRDQGEDRRSPVRPSTTVARPMTMKPPTTSQPLRSRAPSAPTASPPTRLPTPIAVSIAGVVLRVGDDRAVEHVARVDDASARASRRRTSGRPR